MYLYMRVYIMYVFSVRRLYAGLTGPGMSTCVCHYDTCIHTHTHITCIKIYIASYVHKFLTWLTNMHTRNMYVCMCVCVCIHIYIYIHIYIHKASYPHKLLTSSCPALCSSNGTEKLFPAANWGSTEACPHPKLPWSPRTKPWRWWQLMWYQWQNICATQHDVVMNLSETFEKVVSCVCVCVCVCVPRARVRV